MERREWPENIKSFDTASRTLKLSIPPVYFEGGHSHIPYNGAADLSQGSGGLWDQGVLCLNAPSAYSVQMWPWRSFHAWGRIGNTVNWHSVQLKCHIYAHEVAPIFPVSHERIRFALVHWNGPGRPVYGDIFRDRVALEGSINVGEYSSSWSGPNLDNRRLYTILKDEFRTVGSSDFFESSSGAKSAANDYRIQSFVWDVSLDGLAKYFPFPDITHGPTVVGQGDLYFVVQTSSFLDGINMSQIGFSYTARINYTD